MRFGNALKNSTAVPMQHARRPGSREYIFGRGNEINASSNREVIETIASMLALAQEGKLQTHEEPEDTLSIQEATAMVVAAFNDKSSNAWKDFGATLAADLQEHVEREGFMRRILKELTVTQGNFPRHRVQTILVQAIMSTGSGRVLPQMVREKWITPPEWTSMAEVLVTRQDINQTPGDILDERYNEGLQALMTQQDRATKACLDATVGIYNPLVYAGGGLTPAIISAMSTRVYTQIGSQGGSVLLAADYWEDIQTNSSFGAYYDPVTKLELIQNGVLGRFFGREFITDGFRHPVLKVLGYGELYMLGQPEFLGGYTERGPVESAEIDGATRGQAGSRGWAFAQDISVAVHNAKAVQKAVRA